MYIYICQDCLDTTHYEPYSELGGSVAETPACCKHGDLSQLPGEQECGCISKGFVWVGLNTINSRPYHN